MLRIRSAFKTFNARTANEVRALRGIDLEVPEGCFVSVIGTNGSGKSTLLNAIAGMFYLDTGTIHLGDDKLTRWPEHRRAAWIGRVFQNPFLGTSASMTIAENIALAMRRGRFRGLRRALTASVRREIRDRIRSLNMGLEDRLENPMGTLSGGQRQALTLLMATWLRPRLLLLDEHTAALDPKSANQVAALTKQIIEREQLTALMVTHSMQQAIQLSDRIVMMHGGRIIRDYQGAEKKRLRTTDLVETFEQVRRLEQLDESAAEVLARQYV
jgi:putative tryptophan/tyrosine transport system ATP-binding protein